MRAWLEEPGTTPGQTYLRKVKEYETAKAEWDRKHPDGIFTLGDLPPSPPSKVSYNHVGISLHVYPYGNTYDIFPWYRLDSETDILWWVKHLAGKLWCDRCLIRDFVELTTAKLEDFQNRQKEVQG